MQSLQPKPNPIPNPANPDRPLYPITNMPQSGRATPKPKRLSQSMIFLIAGLAFLGIVMCAVLAAFMVYFGNIYGSGNIMPNVTVRGAGVNAVALGGMSIQEATTQLQSVAPAKQITLRDQNRTWTISSADFGIAVDAAATAQKAQQVGHSDVTAGLSQLFGSAEVTPIYTVDLTKTGTAFTNLTDKINIAPDPTNPTTTGRRLNLGATLDKLPGDIDKFLQNPTLDLVMDVVQGPRTTYTVQRGEELGLIAKKFNVDIQTIVTLNKISNPDQIDPGQQLIIPANGLWTPTEKDAPPAPLAQGKAIVVMLSEQRIYAYENGHLTHSTLMSSGLPGHDTVQGDFHVYVKYVTTRMTGPGYDIPDVPWTMYFYQGYGIHGAYWHNVFGRQASHGCVNLETSEAKWFYDFAPIGTLVRVVA